MTPDHGRLSSWSYLRAALISVALLGQCVSALPQKALTEEKLARPDGQRAVRWLSQLADHSEEEARAQLIAWSERGIALRAWALTPLAPVLQGAALRQQWNLFLTIGDDAYRLRIDAREPHGDWTMVYSANGLDSLGLAPLLDYRRVRGVYNPNKHGTRREYAAWCSWLAQRILREHPEYSDVRVSQEHFLVAARGEEPQLIDTRFDSEHSRSELP